MYTKIKKSQGNTFTVVGRTTKTKLHIGITKHTPNVKEISFQGPDKIYTQEVNMHPYQKEVGIEIATARSKHSPFISLPIKDMNEETVEALFNSVSQSAITEAKQQYWTND